MKKVLSTILAVVLLVTGAAEMTGCKRVPKDWYKGALEYYGNGIKNGFDDENQNLNVSDELKNPAYKKGYLIRDLDGDGTDELLIGLIEDGSSYTRFTNVVVFQPGVGTFSKLSGGNGYYIYLCASEVLRVDSWYGSKTEMRYMTYDSKDACFVIIDGEGKYLPMKWELTPFE
jgi:hypothetical protein